jgi:hypothetical protein
MKTEGKQNHTAKETFFKEQLTGIHIFSEML